MNTNDPTLTQRLFAEFLGTAFLLAAIVGSGIMAQRLTDDVGLQLLQNAIATVAALGALIVAFGPISGAHFNPAVTLAERLLGRVEDRVAAAYMATQIAGAAAGVIVANLMFERPAIDISTTERTGAHLVLAETVATFGLVIIILLVARAHSLSVVAMAVAGYIGGAYAFTASTSFANPAVTLARTLSDTFAGIEPASILPFIGAQVVGTGLAVVAFRAMVEPRKTDAITR